jgi:hypothetical protein
MSTIDEAFLPLSELLPLLLPDLSELRDDTMGVLSTVTGVDLETPVELDIVVDPSGRVAIGGTPPIYHLETSSLPVFHQVRFTAVRDEATR